MVRLLYVFAALFLGFCNFVASIIVDLPNGKVEGITEVTRERTTYHSFLALRYAKPPVGDLRFELPQPLDPWPGVYDATREKNICFQTMSNPRDQTESEDCLFVNVFTPKNLNASNLSADLPVMAYIHGGGFMDGSAYRIKGGIGAEFFMDYGVILVAFNSRLGPFGFASTGDTVLPGNLGLKDQVFALKWVRENIKYFGGNPEKVTIFGESSGASCVSYQLLSPMAKGLFVGAIQQSGSALEPWSYQRNQKRITQNTAAVLRPNLPVHKYSSTELYNLLKSAPAYELDRASMLVAGSYGPAGQIIQLTHGFAYAPVIEPEHESAFLTERHLKLFESGNINNVPVISGITSEESLIVVPNGWSLEFFKAYDKNPEYLVADDMHIKDAANLAKVAKRIRDYYVGNNSFKDSVAYGLQFHSMHTFDKAAIRQAELQAKYSNSVYFYEFTYDGKLGYNRAFRIIPWVPGVNNVTHGGELKYMFSGNDNTDPRKFPAEDWTVHHRIMTLWTNFAKYQHPTPRRHKLLQNVKWSNVKANQFQYLEIGKDLKVVNDFPKSESYKFWKDLFNEFAVPPLDTF